MRTRATVIAIFLLGALVASGAAAARNANLVLDRGIVQSVSSGQVVLRALDGRTIPITIGSHTKVFLNNGSASLSAIQPGFVVSALHDGNRPAVYVRAVGRAQAPLVTDKGVIVSVSSNGLVLRSSGGVVTIAVGPGTNIQLNGKSASIGDLRPGYSAEVTHRGSDPAQAIRAKGSRR